MPEKRALKRDYQVPEKRGGAPIKHALYRKIDFGNLDGRCTVAKSVKAIKEALREFVPDPSPTTELLISRITYKSIRLALYESHMLADPAASFEEASSYLPLSNSLRNDLKVLAEMAGKREQEAPDLSQYIEATYGDKK